MSKIVPTEHEYNVALGSNANSLCPQSVFTKQIDCQSVFTFGILNDPASPSGNCSVVC
jgi:hypothetical protein